MLLNMLYSAAAVADVNAAFQRTTGSGDDAAHAIKLDFTQGRDA